MSKTISFTLSADSIDQAIKALNEYRDELKFKTSVFVQRLSEVGLKTIDAHKYSQGDSDFNDLRSYVWLDYEGSKVRATLVLSGKDVAFIEFGAGVHFNGAVGSSPNQFGQKLGLTIGSYGQGKGAQDSWSYFDEETGRVVTSHGTQAAMPMAHAYEEIRNRFMSVAKEVFGNE